MARTNNAVKLTYFRNLLIKGLQKDLKSAAVEIAEEL